MVDGAAARSLGRASAPPPAGEARVAFLDDSEAAWAVARGRAELYLVKLEEGAPAAPRRLLAELEEGAFLFPAPADGGDGPRLMALALGEGALVRFERSELLRRAGDGDRDDVAAAVEGWIETLAAPLAEGGEAPGRWLRAGEAAELAPGVQAGADAGVVWLRPSEGALRLGPAGVLPPRAAAATTRRLAVAAVAPTVVRPCATREFIAAAGWWESLLAFNGAALSELAARFAADDLQETERLAARGQRAARALSTALGRLATAVDQRGAFVDETEDALAAACRLIAADMKVPLRLPADPAERERGGLEAIARASKLRVRRVALRGAWWREDLGPLLCRFGDDERPGALLPRRGGYRLIDPANMAERAVNAQVAETVSPLAYAFVRTLPEGPLRPRDLLRFVASRFDRDVLAVLWTGLAAGAIAMLPPILVGYLFSAAIPDRDVLQALQLGAMVAFLGLAAVVVRLAGDVALLRFEGRAAAGLQAALIDRVLRLPAHFFAAYSSADLASRIVMVETLRRMLSATVVASVLAGGFSVVTLSVLFYYFPLAAAVAALLAAVLIGAALLTARLQRHMVLGQAAAEGTLHGVTAELIFGVTKLRLAAAERLAFARWARVFAEMRRRVVGVQRYGVRFNAYLSAHELVSLLAVFALTAASADRLTVGAFLAFIAAYGTFGAAMQQAAGALVQLLMMAPLAKRFEPVLAAPVEREGGTLDPGVLSGAVEVSGLVFRYPGGPNVLNGVSLKASPGEFIAIVGPSGCGKSTLMRLLLGFERPLSGAVFYDGRDLRSLDLAAVRRQIGVVLQSGRLTPGSILQNVAGAHRCSLEEAMEAIRLAGLEADIRAMPMGLHTILAEGSAGLSGGQMQRLLIARALVGRPRLLLFDEATSALDNRTQAMVMDNLARLQVTRICVAHRLSTVQQADRIYVMAKGAIVESGSYAELMAADGVFAALARRQLV